MTYAATKIDCLARRFPAAVYYLKFLITKSHTVTHHSSRIKLSSVFHNCHSLLSSLLPKPIFISLHILYTDCFVSPHKLLRFFIYFFWVFNFIQEKVRMADHHSEEEVKADSLTEKISDKIKGHDDSSSSSSDDDGVKKTSSFKAKVFRLFGREKPVHKVLGGGKPADVFMWRNKKISAGVLGVATAIWVLFEVIEYHFLTLVCHGLILVLAVLFLWSNASTFINKSPPRIPEVSLPEKPVVQFATDLRVTINQGFAAVRDIASGRDLKKFLSVIAGLWIFSILGSCCDFLTLLYITTVLLHTVPVIYDKYEDKVDSFAEKALEELKKQYAVFDKKVMSKIPRGPMKDKKRD